MASATDKRASTQALESETSFLLRLGSDLLELIVQLLLDDAQDENSATSSLSTITRISHVCSTLRHVLISRLSFWNSIRCTEDTRMDAVVAQLDRAGDVPLQIDMQRGTRSLSAVKQYPTDNNEVFAALFQQMHRAAKVRINAQSRQMTAFDHAASEPHVTLLPYAERPLEELELHLTRVGNLLELIGPKCTKLVLRKLYTSHLFVKDLEAALAAAPALGSLTIEHIKFEESNSINRLTTSGAGFESPCQTLKELVLTAVEPLYTILPLILRLFPGTALLGQAVQIGETEYDSWDHPESIVQMLQLSSLGPPNAMYIVEDGDEYQVNFPNGINRKFSLPEYFDYHADQQSRNIVLGLLNSTTKLTIVDGDTFRFDSWLQSWYGSTWSSVTSLQIYLEHGDHQTGPQDMPMSNPSHRIYLPNLKEFVVTGHYYDYERMWATECAILLDTFVFPNHVVVDLRDVICWSSIVATDRIQKAVNDVYRIHHGRAYFTER
ncbi:hypothetical protein BKA62DRAFT_726277 [Auriculariales sp. MPI-PUGE-AT-0066]|nr:hypothetical protein BKA62DRAFT_726277 [Auriculariales sp. MPI-PUGE-AT-0066]